MFKKCSAHLLVPENEWQTRLSYVIRQIGFSETHRLHSPKELENNRPGLLPFLLLHSNIDPAMTQDYVSMARLSGNDDIRFMPIIMLADDRSEASVERYLKLGCDDIILYPCSGASLARRLRMQIGLKHDYFQTKDYFGPDRRKNEAGAPHSKRRGGRDAYYRHIEIKRTVRGGIKVLSNQSFDPNEKLAPSA